MSKLLKRVVKQQPYINRSQQNLGTWMRLLTEETSQVNLIVLNPLTFDGWYTHGERGEWHVCIKGNILVAVHDQGVEPTGELHSQAVYVPNLSWHGLYNASDEPAWVLVFAEQVHNRGDDEFPLPVGQDELDTLETLWNHYYEGENSNEGGDNDDN